MAIKILDLTLISCVKAADAECLYAFSFAGISNVIDFESYGDGVSPEAEREDDGKNFDEHLNESDLSVMEEEEEEEKEDTVKLMIHQPVTSETESEDPVGLDEDQVEAESIDLSMTQEMKKLELELEELTLKLVPAPENPSQDDEIKAQTNQVAEKEVEVEIPNQNVANEEEYEEQETLRMATPPKLEAQNQTRLIPKAGINITTDQPSRKSTSSTQGEQQQTQK